MPRKETVLEVFVASPAELRAERTVLAEVINELNTVWARSLGIRLDLVRWETHAYPAFGEDAQDVINDQIPQDYDLFIGLMWARFGTATGRAGSGTAEEFERALARFRADPSSVQLMVYFKDAPKPMSEIDPDQLRSVNAFRKRVEDEGGLHWTFTTIDEFAANLRIHLARFVQSWTHSEAESVSRAAQAAAAGQPAIFHQQSPSETDDLGYLDLVESTTATLTALGETQQRLSTISQDFTANIQAHTAEMDATNKKDGEVSPTVYKRIANRVADDMEQFSRRTRLELSQFERQLSDAFDSTAKVASLAWDFGPNSEAVASLPLLADQVERFGRIMGDNADTARALRATMASSPRITTAYNRAKKTAVNALDETIRILSDASEACARVAAGIRELIPRKPDI